MAEGGSEGEVDRGCHGHIMVMVAENIIIVYLRLRPQLGHNWPQLATISATMATMATIGHKLFCGQSATHVATTELIHFFSGKGGNYFRAPLSA